MFGKQTPFNKDTLDSVENLKDMKVYQPTRPITSDLTKPGSTSDLVGKLAQLGQGNTGSSVAGATRVVASSSVSVAGPQGVQGPIGIQGPQGDIGAQGVQGNQGNQGPAGPQGAQGPSGLLNYAIAVNGHGVSTDAAFFVNGSIASTTPWGTQVNGVGI